MQRSSATINKTSKIFESSVSPKGQITLPIEMRQRLRIEPGDKVQFKEDHNKIVIEKRANGITALFGILKSPKQVSLEEMEQGIIKGATRNFKSSKKSKGTIK